MLAPRIDDMVNKPYQAVKDALVSLPCLFPDDTVYRRYHSGNWYRRAICRGVHDSWPS
jgi:hypothetical protein